VHETHEGVPTVVIGSSHRTARRARATVRSVAAVGGPGCVVVDVDGTYPLTGSERVVTLLDAARPLAAQGEAARAAATLEPADLDLYAALVGAEGELGRGAPAVLVLRAGVHLLRDPAPLLVAGESLGVPAVDVVGAQRLAGVGGAVRREVGPAGRTSRIGPGAGALLSRSFVVLGSGATASGLRELVGDWRLSEQALDLVVTSGAVRLESDELLVVSPWHAVPSVARDDGRVLVGAHAPVALDLGGLDLERPWLLDADAATAPRVLLSEHPVLAEIVERQIELRRADGEADGADGPSQGSEPGPALRAEARRVDAEGGVLPDVLGTGDGPSVTAWALELVPPEDPKPLARYLWAVRETRPDLQRNFRRVPGPGSAALATWASEAGGHDDLDPDLLARASAVTLEALQRVERGSTGPLEAGVNLVGYLSGELGVGTSVRLVDEALQAAGVPTSTDDVGAAIASRRGAAYRRSDRTRRRTTLLCVNAAETPGVARIRADLLASTRVIGMWYWELEDFPASQHAAFAHVDEVWVATDFVREAVAPHAGAVPVRTVTPPLPQAGPDPGRVPERFGIPLDRPWLLFTFDFLSFAERKNPHGLVEAFTRAFADRPEHERPTLVIKTINADRHPADAERLRLLIAGRSDVRHLDTYLDDDERHVLVANCTAYVSLHRAEGLGLTVAEAMAWGRPVVTTRYGGVTQFCDEDNTFLVDWAPTSIGEDVGPYERGMTWAEPDLDHAAQLMRLVVDEPDRARAVGERAARDIRERHHPGAAGARMRQVLAHGDLERTEPDHPPEPQDAGRAGPEGLGGRLRAAVTRRRGERH